VPLPYIRDILGHVDLSTTEIYARASTEAKRKASKLPTPASSPATCPNGTRTPASSNIAHVGDGPGYAEVCGRTMARAHSRSDDAAASVG
jgi:hypothetical protein